ncbi:MAG: hypothetical protein Q7T03_05060, partial [Deltaproteobacteria bacterium]|nr:hypothetical protein [Deltaproteobacteria bacterium]
KEAPDTQMVVVGDTRIFQNNFLEMFETNGVFLENAADVLSTGDKLISVRSKGFVEQPIAILTDATRLFIKAVDLLLSPLLLLGVGGMIFWHRRRVATRLRKQFAS